MPTPRLTFEQRYERSVDLGIIVDPENFHLLENYTWNETTGGHLVTTINNKSVYLHHLVNGFPPIGFETDHGDRDPKNNRDNNLSNKTKSGNVLNSNRIDASLYIYPQPERGYFVTIQRKGKKYYLGTFGTVEECQVVRDNWLAAYARGEIDA